MYQALYRKYRPTVFDDVVGQEHITETLKNSLSSGKIFHAYLFTGTRGTGKTTCAKILANSVCCESPVNGEPCGECSACKLIAKGAVTYISEIDAASNNGVNDIRELREQVNFLPVSLKYRVYIIDEVHMLTTSAFNALLKTLEEPPAHVVFILATTEVHKLPATILSRCQRFDFRRLEPSVICQRLEKVAKSEGVNITPDAALKIAALADGGMRDALSILDQCASVGEDITLNLISDVCGTPDEEELLSLVEAIGGKNTAQAISMVDGFYRNSLDMKKLTFDLITCFRNLMVIKTVKDAKELIVCSEDELKRLKDLADMFTLSEIIYNISVLQEAGESISTFAARSDVELAIIKLCTPELSGNVEALVKRIEALERAVNTFKTEGVSVIATDKKEAPLKGQDQTEKALAEKDMLVSEVKAAAPAEKVSPKAEIKAAPQSGEPVLVEKWPEIMELVKKSCPLMAGVLDGSKAYIGGGRLLIDSKLSQFKELINSDAKYRDYIRNAAEQVLGVAYNLGPYKPPVAKENKAAEVDPLAEFARSLNEAKNSL